MPTSGFSRLNKQKSSWEEFSAWTRRRQSAASSLLLLFYLVPLCTLARMQLSSKRCQPGAGVVNDVTMAAKPPATHLQKKKKVLPFPRSAAGAESLQEFEESFCDLDHPCHVCHSLSVLLWTLTQHALLSNSTSTWMLIRWRLKL